jgi:hypothetical protein
VRDAGGLRPTGSGPRRVPQSRRSTAQPLPPRLVPHHRGMGGNARENSPARNGS